MIHKSTIFFSVNSKFQAFLRKYLFSTFKMSEIFERFNSILQMEKRRSPQVFHPLQIILSSINLSFNLAIDKKLVATVAAHVAYIASDSLLLRHEKVTRCFCVQATERLINRLLPFRPRKSRKTCEDRRWARKNCPGASQSAGSA